MTETVNIDNACDYVILKVCEGGESLNHLKLQKLMYYVQAWHLAFYGTPLFEGKFQAWVHGPVNRFLYDRFLPTKSLYSDIAESDIRQEFDPESLPEESRAHIDTILETYAPFSGTQLEIMTHEETPWVAARKGYRDSERCTRDIDESLMATYYGARLAENYAEA